MKQIKAYCTQNDGDCSTCSLVNYGHDCQNNKVGGQDEIDNALADIMTEDLRRQGR